MILLGNFSNLDVAFLTGPVLEWDIAECIGISMRKGYLGDRIYLVQVAVICVRLYASAIKALAINACKGPDFSPLQPRFGHVVLNYKLLYKNHLILQRITCL